MGKEHDALEGVIDKLREMRDRFGIGVRLNDSHEDLIQELISLCYRFVGVLNAAKVKELKRRSNILTSEIKQDAFECARQGAITELEQAFDGFGGGEEKWQSEYIWHEEKNQIVQVVADGPAFTGT